jgi:hypothetical protein
VLGGCDAVAIGDARVGPGVEQDGQDLLVWFGPVAEQHGLHQCDPAEIVDVVDVGVGFDDSGDVVDVALLRWSI